METLFGILHLILFIYALIQIVGSGAKTGEKVLWIVIVFLLPLIGLIIWLLMGPGSPAKR